MISTRFYPAELIISLQKLLLTMTDEVSLSWIELLPALQVGLGRGGQFGTFQTSLSSENTAKVLRLNFYSINDHISARRLVSLSDHLYIKFYSRILQAQLGKQSVKLSITS